MADLQIIQPATIDQSTVYRDFNAGAWSGFNPTAFVWSAFVVDPAFTPENIAAFDQFGFESEAFQSYFDTSAQNLFPPLIDQSAVHAPVAYNRNTNVDPILIDQSVVETGIVVTTPDQFITPVLADQSEVHAPLARNYLTFVFVELIVDESDVYAVASVTTPDQFISVPLIPDTIVTTQVSGSAVEGQTLTLNAPSGYTFTSIVEAKYGADVRWAYNNAAVTAAFIGQSTGSIAANNAIFGDPASGTVKTLYITLVASRTVDPHAPFEPVVFNSRQIKIGDDVFTQSSVFNPLSVYNSRQIFTAYPVPSGVIDTAGYVLNLSMEGAHNGSAFTDVSGTGKTATNTGSPVTSNTQFKNGATSGYFNGSSYIKYASTSDFDFGSGAFTIEFWMLAPALHGARMLMFGSNGNASSLQMSLNADGSLWFGEATGNNPISGAYAPPGTIAAGSWHHIAMVWESTTVYKIYVNGTQRASGGKAWSTGPRELSIGSDWSYGFHFTGYIDDVRVTKGTARYLGNFTPDTPVNIIPPVQVYNKHQFFTGYLAPAVEQPYDHIVYNRHQYITPEPHGPPLWGEFPLVYNLTQIFTADTVPPLAVSVFLPQNVYNEDVVVQGDTAFTQSEVYYLAAIIQPRQFIDVDVFDSSIVYPPADVFDPKQTEVADAVINQSTVYAPLASNWIYYAPVDLISEAVVHGPQVFVLTQFLSVDTFTQSTVAQPTVYNLTQIFNGDSAFTQSTVGLPTVVVLNRTFDADIAINQSALYGPTVYNSKQVFNGDTAFTQAALYGPLVFTLTQRVIGDLIAAPASLTGPTIFNLTQIVDATIVPDVSLVYTPVVTNYYRTFAADTATNQSTVYTPTVVVLNASYVGDTAFTQSTVYGPTLTLKRQIVQGDSAFTQTTVYTPTAANSSLDIHPALIDQSSVFGLGSVEAVNRVFVAAFIPAPTDAVPGLFDISNYTRTIAPIVITAGEITDPAVFNSTRYFETPPVWESFGGAVFNPEVLILNRTFDGPAVITAGEIYGPASIQNLNREFAVAVIDQSTTYNPFASTLVQNIEPALIDQSNVRTPVATPAPQALMDGVVYVGEECPNLFLTTIANQKLFPRGEVGEEMLADVTTFAQVGMIADAYDGSSASASMVDDFIGLSVSNAYEGMHATAGTMSTEGLIRAYVGDEMLVDRLVTDSILEVNVGLSETMLADLDIHASFGLPTATGYDGSAAAVSLNIIYAGQALQPLIMKVGSSFAADFNRPLVLDLAEDCRCGTPKVYVHTNIDINVEGGDSLFDKYYGDAIYMHAELQCNRRLSAQAWTGENFRAVDESEFVLSLGVVDGGMYARAALEGGSAGVQIHKLCKGNFIPSGNNLPIEIIDALGDDCIEYQFKTGEHMSVGAGLSTTVQLVARIAMDDMHNGYADLIIDPPWQAIGRVEITTDVYLTTDRDMRMGPAIAYEGVNWAGGKFHEEFIDGYTGEYATATLVIEYEVEFVDGGSLMNEYQYQLPDGEVDIINTTTVAIETYYFRHDLKARCF